MLGNVLHAVLLLLPSTNVRLQSDKNSIARLSNAAIVTVESSLSPIFTHADRVVNGFPETLADLDGLTGKTVNSMK